MTRLRTKKKPKPKQPSEGVLLGHRRVLVAFALGMCAHTLWHDYSSLRGFSVASRENGNVNQTEWKDDNGTIMFEEEAITEATLDNSNSTTSWRQFKNRTIAFVHVGKAGGMTLRSSTTLGCGWNKKKCLEEMSPNAVLARQVQHVIHMFNGGPPGAIENSTSFLINLRNPVDRIVSTYKYSHPANCLHMPRGVAEAYGCDLTKMAQNSSFQSYYHVYPMFNTCFPLPAMEDFAQTVLPPWPNITTTHLLEPEQEKWCRIHALGMVQGKGPSKPAPHMFYNYQNYKDMTVQKHPDKEVFAVRTEHEWEDIKALDLAIGGGGSIPNEGKSESHGSEKYAPSPLTEQAYQKLCCVLEKEIVVYQEFLSLAVNLEERDKKESMENVKQKCGITTSWEEWRQHCQARIKVASVLLSSPPLKRGTREKVWKTSNKSVAALRRPGKAGDNNVKPAIQHPWKIGDNTVKPAIQRPWKIGDNNVKPAIKVANRQVDRRSG